MRMLGNLSPGAVSACLGGCFAYCWKSTWFEWKTERRRGSMELCHGLADASHETWDGNESGKVNPLTIVDLPSELRYRVRVMDVGNTWLALCEGRYWIQAI